jgi:hypothetical protein
MPASTDYEPNNICVVRISGILKQSEFSASLGAVGRKVDTGSKPRLLAILEDFQEWEREADWNDLDFFICMAARLQRSPSLPSPVGRCRRLPLPERESVAHRFGSSRLTRSGLARGVARSRPDYQKT